MMAIKQADKRTISISSCDVSKGQVIFQIVELSRIKDKVLFVFFILTLEQAIIQNVYIEFSLKLRGKKIVINLYLFQDNF